MRHGQMGGEKQGKGVEIGGDGKAEVAIVGGCGGLGSAQGEGMEFPRSLLQTKGVLGPQ